MNSLLLATTGAPGTVQRLQNQLGTAVSRETTNVMLSNLLSNKDGPVGVWKAGVEKMWQDCFSQARRRTEACTNSPGFVLAGDNVGKVTTCQIND